MINVKIRAGWDRLMKPVGRTLARTPLSPDAVTAMGVALQIVAAVLILQGSILAAGIVGAVAGFFDSFDGALAKARGTPGRFGALLDSTTDRLSDALIFIPIAWLYAVDPDIPARDEPWVAAAALVALVAAFLVSYVRARAEGLGFDCNVGLAERAERLIAMNAALILNIIPPVVAILAAASVITVGQRLAHVRRQDKRAS